MRGQLIERGEKKWLLRVYMGRTAGKRQYRSKTFHGTTREAQQELTRMLREGDTHPDLTGTKQTVEQYLREWLKTKLDIRPSTQVDYQKRIERNILPTVGNLRLDHLTYVQVNRLYRSLVEQGFSPRTVRYTHQILHHALEQAVLWGLLPKNPSAHAVLPQRVQRTPTILTAPQLARLIRETAQEPLGALWTLLLTSGLRSGEALALRWADLEDTTLHVRRTLVTNGHGRFTIMENAAKTAGSIRGVTLPAITLEALEQHRRRQAAQIMLAGPRYERQDLMFCTSLGRTFNPHNVRRYWYRTLARLGLPQVRLYDTRHTHATALLTQGVNLAWVSERLGHTNIQTTKSVYAHVLPEAQREMANVMDTIARRQA